MRPKYGIHLSSQLPADQPKRQDQRMSKKIPLFDTVTPLVPLRERIDAAIAAVIDSGRFILGPEVRAFEAEFSDYVGASFGVGVGNGTDAITIALRALGIGPGDDVIVPAFTFFASAEAIPATGARPVFCDIDPQTFNMTLESVTAALTPRTRAIVVVHLFGAPAPMPELVDFAREHDLVIVEDAAQAVGAKLQGRAVGSFGDAATFSFFPSKNLGAFGDGGMIVTSNADAAERARRLRLHGSTDKSTHSEVGYNSRLDEIQAAILRVLLPELDSWNAARRRAAREYVAAGIGDFAAPQKIDPACEPVYHLFMVSHDQPELLIGALTEANIEARGYYRVPIHLQPAMAEFAAAGELPGTAEAARSNIALPISPSISQWQIAHVVDTARAAALENAK